MPPPPPLSPCTPPVQVIEAYLLDKYAGVGPSLQPPTPELRAKAQLARRVHDLYIQPLQVGCWGMLWGGVGGRQRGAGVAHSGALRTLWV